MDSEKPYVYHGSSQEFDSEVAKPKKNIRIKVDSKGNEEVIFDEESFHATPERWITLAYTDLKNFFEIDGRKIAYSMGVNLYENNREVIIFGCNSLEASLKVLYGDGGYLYHFDRNKFLYKEGLGSMEVVVNEPADPVVIERVDDPVAEMRKLGVEFVFVDLSLPENENKRVYI